MNNTTRVDKLNEIKKESVKKKVKKVMIWILVILLVCLVVLGLYSYFIEPRFVLINETVLKDDKISDSFDGVKILHFSDLHYGSNINKKNIDKIIDKFNSSKPDIVIFTGDLIKEGYELTVEDVDILTKALNKIEARIGKYSVYGNHDYYANYLEKITDIYKNSDFKLLQNSYELVYNNGSVPIMIYGVDDVLASSASMENMEKNDYYKIVLVHEPDYADMISDDEADLILAGHSHNGQVNIPLLKKLVLPPYSKKYYKAYYKVNNNPLYVSSGLGCSLWDIRFLNPPSYNLFRLKKEK